MTKWFRSSALIVLVVTGLWASERWWSPALARTLVCTEDTSPSGALLLENFDPDYLVFERARGLRKDGVATRVLVPTRVDKGTRTPNAVAVGFVEVLTRISRLEGVEIVPVEEAEPISLNVGRQIRDFLTGAGIRSVTVVSPQFRSRRSQLVYEETLGKAGISVHCVPASSGHSVENWTETWHGIQNVAEQWLKLQYYRWWVLAL
ncbi:MAG: hypothetical protein AB7I50_17795 [Vicinamibacterales bacterium]